MSARGRGRRLVTMGNLWRWDIYGGWGMAAVRGVVARMLDTKQWD